MRPYPFTKYRPPTGYATWNPSDKDTNVVLSNGNMRADRVSGAGYTSVRSTNSVVGKRYFELLHNVVTTGGNTSAGGVSDGTQGISTPNYVGIASLSAGLWVPPGNVYTNGAAIGAGLGAQPGGVTRSEWAIDATTRKIWVRLHGGGWLLGGDPALGTTPTATLTGSAGIFAMATPYLATWWIDLVSDPANMLGTAPAGFTAGL